MAEEKLASRWLLSTNWLGEHLNDPNVIVFDCSFYLANAKRDADAEFFIHEEQVGVLSRGQLNRLALAAIKSR